MMYVPCRQRFWCRIGSGFWVSVVSLEQTVELSPETWRARLEQVFQAAEGRTVAALERQEER